MEYYRSQSAHTVFSPKETVGLFPSRSVRGDWGCVLSSSTISYLRAIDWHKYTKSLWWPNEFLIRHWIWCHSLSLGETHTHTHTHMHPTYRTVLSTFGVSSQFANTVFVTKLLRSCASALCASACFYASTVFTASAFLSLFSYLW